MPKKIKGGAKATEKKPAPKPMPKPAKTLKGFAGVK